MSKGAFSQALRAAIAPRAKSLSMVPAGTGTGGWQSIIREPFAGAWQRNLEINAATASSFFADFSCRTLIARDIAKMGVKLMRRAGNGIWSEVVDDGVITQILQRPNHYSTVPQFWESWVNSKLSRGNTYVLLSRDARRNVVAMHVLNPNRVQVLVADDGSVFYQLSTDELNGLPAQVTVASTELIHDRFNCLFHPLIGVPPIYAAALAATQGLNIQHQSIRLFRNNASPGGILSAPGTIDDVTANRVKADFEQMFGGQNLGRVAVLGDALKFEKMALTSEEAQLVEQLRFAAETICSVYHVPSYKIGVGPRPSYASASQLDEEYFASAIQSLVEDAEAALDRGLGIGKAKGLMTEFDVDNLIRMNLAAQAEVTTKLVGGGVKTPNEGRRDFNLAPLDGGDTVYMQQQDVPLALAAAQNGHPLAPGVSAPKSLHETAEVDWLRQQNKMLGRWIDRLERASR